MAFPSGSRRHLSETQKHIGRPFRAGFLMAVPRAKALGCSVRPFHGQELRLPFSTPHWAHDLPYYNDRARNF